MKSISQCILEPKIDRVVIYFKNQKSANIENLLNCLRSNVSIRNYRFKGSFTYERCFSFFYDSTKVRFFYHHHKRLNHYYLVWIAFKEPSQLFLKWLAVILSKFEIKYVISYAELTLDYYSDQPFRIMKAIDQSLLVKRVPYIKFYKTTIYHRWPRQSCCSVKRYIKAEDRIRLELSARRQKLRRMGINNFSDLIEFPPSTLLNEFSFVEVDWKKYLKSYTRKQSKAQILGRRKQAIIREIVSIAQDRQREKCLGIALEYLFSRREFHIKTPTKKIVKNGRCFSSAPYMDSRFYRLSLLHQSVEQALASMTSLVPEKKSNYIKHNIELNLYSTEFK